MASADRARDRGGIPVLSTMVSKSARLLAAGIISFLLFTSIPLVRGIFGLKRPDHKAIVEHRRIIAEMVRTPPTKNVTPVKNMRRITTTSPGRMGSSEQNGLTFKIIPDLSVEGGGGAGVAMQGQELEAMVFEEGQTDENVVPLFVPSIAYPQRAKEMGIQGTLEAVITIDRDGKVIKVDIVKSPHPSITEEARKMIVTWRFKPAKIKGIPVKVRRIQDIEFKLDNE